MYEEWDTDNEEPKDAPQSYHYQLQQEYLEVSDLLMKMQEAGYYQRETVQVKPHNGGRLYTLNFYDPDTHDVRWDVTADYPALLDFIKAVAKKPDPVKQFYTKSLLESIQVRPAFYRHTYIKGEDATTEWRKSTSPSPTSNLSENSETPTDASSGGDSQSE